MSRSFFSGAMLSSAVMAFWLAGSPSALAKGKNNSGPALKAPYCVVQLDKDVKVVKNSELDALKKKLETDYRAALKEYTKAKAAARKAKEKFDASKPRRTKTRVVSSSQKSLAEATKLRDETFCRIDGYMVVQVGEVLHVTRKSELAKLKISVAADYKKARQAYDDAKKAARKNRRKLTKEKPKREVVKILASKIATRDAARKERRALQKARRAKAS